MTKLLELQKVAEETAVKIHKMEYSLRFLGEGLMAIEEYYNCNENKEYQIRSLQHAIWGANAVAELLESEASIIGETLDNAQFEAECSIKSSLREVR